MTARWIAAACAAALAAAAAGSSAAAGYKYTLTGTLHGTDDAGYFGPAMGSLEGLEFTVVVRLDDLTPGALSTRTSGGSQIQGSGAASPAPASLTINGHTEVFGLGQLTRVSVTDNLPGGAETFGYLADDRTEVTLGPHYHMSWRSLWFDFTALNQNVFANADYRTAFTLAPSAALNVKGGFMQMDVDRLGAGPTRYAQAYNGIFDVRSVVAGAVPEPATWALMLSGFAAVGALLRANRRRIPTSA